MLILIGLKNFLSDGTFTKAVWSSAFSFFFF